MLQTIMTLNDSITKFLKENVADKLELKTTATANNIMDTHYKNPQCVSGWIIPKTIDEDEQSEFPYIVTRVEKIENIDNFQSAVYVKILIGVYCYGEYKDGFLINDSSGYRDIWNLIEKIRQALFTQDVIDKKFAIDKEFFKADTPPEQPYPQWQGTIMTKWTIFLP